MQTFQSPRPELSEWGVFRVSVYKHCLSAADLCPMIGLMKIRGRGFFADHNKICLKR